MRYRLDDKLVVAISSRALFDLEESHRVFVDQGVDTGAIIAQGIVNVEDEDTAKSLREKIQEAEHRVYPAAIAAIAQGEIGLRSRRTYRRIDP